MDFRLTFITIAAALSAGCSDNYEKFTPEHTLWYDEPASTWEETLPLGNGRDNGRKDRAQRDIYVERKRG